jgi:hypothetical protein
MSVFDFSQLLEHDSRANFRGVTQLNIEKYIIYIIWSFRGDQIH